MWCAAQHPQRQQPRGRSHDLRRPHQGAAPVPPRPISPANLPPFLSFRRKDAFPCRPHSPESFNTPQLTCTITPVLPTRPRPVLSLPYPALPCLTLTCPALPCPALPCPTLPCPAHRLTWPLSRSWRASTRATPWRAGAAGAAGVCWWTTRRWRACPRSRRASRCGWPGAPNVSPLTLTLNLNLNLTLIALWLARCARARRPSRHYR